MMQRTVGMYIANRIKDEILKPPTVEEEVEDQYIEQEDHLDGEVVTNADGMVLGVAHRLRDIAVYVVGSRSANPNIEMERALHDPDADVIIHREGRHITALVYVPTESAQLPSSGNQGLRADEV